ncbi:MAG: alpha/beta hydrolase [Pseudomonadota bacterium]
MPRGYIDGPSGQLHYRLEGTGAPLLMLHQALSSQRQFDEAYALLAARDVCAIGMDLPGYGQSDPPAGMPSIKDYAAAAAALIEALALGPMHVVGHHTGAQVATELALGWPHLTTALILNGPLPMDEKQRAEGLAYVERAEKNMPLHENGSHLVTLFENRNSYRPPGTPLIKPTRYVAEAFMGLGPLWHAHHAAFRHDHGAAIAKLRCPTLILTNTGDALYPHAQETRAMRPDFSYVELAGGGIDIVDEAPEAWVAAVADFIVRSTA